jgi:cytochrome c2
MMDAEALEKLEMFALGHGLCEEQAISTEFVEDHDTGGIHVIKRCQVCHALVLATVTKGAAKVLLRQ